MFVGAPHWEIFLVPKHQGLFKSLCRATLVEDKEVIMEGKEAITAGRYSWGKELMDKEVATEDLHQVMLGKEVLVGGKEVVVEDLRQFMSTEVIALVIPAILHTLRLTLILVIPRTLSMGILKKITGPDSFKVTLFSLIK